VRRGLALAAAVALLPLSISPALAATPPPASTYTNYAAPGTLGNGAGEPSIGANWKTGAALIQSNTQTLKATFDDSTAPATATWKDVSGPLAPTSLDPILFTDSAQGRTYVSQLLLACSDGYLTDNDGASYTQSEGCGAGTAFDHQTVGAGPYSSTTDTGSTPVPPHTYPNAFYYCAQYVASANCARSDNGGLTYGAGVPIYNTGVGSGVLSCAGLHGHLRVAPDGAAYVPNFDCDGKVAVTVSRDNGTTWNVRKVPTSTTQDESDPSVAAGSGGTLYLGWEEGASNATGSRPYVGVSRDHGKTWTNITDVGATFGIRNVQFPEVIAGDDDRAAFAFLGTPTAGDDQAMESTGTPGSGFSGVWHLYIARTYDGGVTWQTVDATPTDPAQRGCIWLNGGSSECRNLLDFNDITVDKQGRVLVGWADGCVAECVTAVAPGNGKAKNDTTNRASYRAKKATITRQSSGLGLFAAFDSPSPDQTVPEAPYAGLLPVAGLALLGVAYGVRRRRAA